MMTHLELGISDLDRALELYSGLLGFPLTESTVDTEGHRIAILGNEPALRLVELGTTGTASGWDPDDRQCGIRHFGMKVADIDAWTQRLKAAGLTFALDPVDAFGDVRIAFFFDPDGAYLELIQGYVQHNDLWSPALAQAEIDADRDWDGSPRFDHIALTVPDLAESLAHYQALGFTPVGQLVQPTEPRGFLITNLRAGPATLEIFTFTAPTLASPAASPNALGLREVAFRRPAPVAEH
jgi:catechol 2,3-dioxygenase-like lactoylglutathione lyase family enzyme